ncbi:hypothetical protein [Nocardiopsis alba]
MTTTPRFATAADVARTQMAWSIEDGWQPTTWDVHEQHLPDAVAAAIVAELRARVIGIKDSGPFRDTHVEENGRQAGLNEVLDLLTAYSHPYAKEHRNMR